MIQQRRAPLGPPFWAPYWASSGITRAATMQHHTPKPNVSSFPQPIPLGEVGLHRFCETRGGGKGLFATRNSLT